MYILSRILPDLVSRAEMVNKKMKFTSTQSSKLQLSFVKQNTSYCDAKATNAHMQTKCQTPHVEKHR